MEIDEVGPERMEVDDPPADAMENGSQIDILMTTKENKHFEKQLQLSSSSCTKNGQNFYNFNLTQHQTSLNTVVSVQSVSNSKNDKLFGNIVTDNYQEKRKSWNKLSKNLSLKTSKKFVLSSKTKDGEKPQKRWMANDKNNSMNDSTLSLHIAAYENSFDVASNDESKGLSKESKATKFVDSLPNLHLNQNFLEFPRQLDTNKSAEPEIQQFKASQKLFSPKQNTTSSSQMHSSAIEVPSDSHDMAEPETTARACQCKENYHGLNKAINIYLILFMLLILGIIASLTWAIILAFTGNRTVELSSMIVLFVLQSFIVAVHGFFLQKKIRVYGIIALILDVAMVTFLIALIVMVIVKSGAVVNPQYRTLPVNIALALIHIFAIFGDFNLLRFLHPYQKHWIGTKLIGRHSLHFSSTNVHKDEKDAASKKPTVYDYDLIEIKSADSLRESVDADRQQCGQDSGYDESYPEEMNPFAGEIEVESPSLSAKEDSTQGFSNEKFQVTASSDNEPQSVYFMDVQQKLSESGVPATKEEKPKYRRRSRDARPMKYMAHFHENSNQTRVMLPDGTFVTPCPWDPHQITSNETSPRILHPTSSVILEKAPVPVPEYRERADFISLLPNTKV